MWSALETPQQRHQCPDCSTLFRRVHSRYERRLLDAAMAGQEMVHLRVRRFFCTLASCARKIYAEQIEGLPLRHSRDIWLIRRMLEAVGLALSGGPGSS
ncbi:transposase family protein [Micromonospora sp. NBC_00898]|uniref:transposase family protein n=1 Tax=Micromonospora sp. NBC_00898 TaxID=2975981 RepID=UPI0038697C98|nr:transposase family protein [Micromonospora sp. NBC_00898]